MISTTKDQRFFIKITKGLDQKKLGVLCDFRRALYSK